MWGRSPRLGVTCILSRHIYVYICIHIISCVCTWPNCGYEKERPARLHSVTCLFCTGYSRHWTLTRTKGIEAHVVLWRMLRAPIFACFAPLADLACRSRLPIPFFFFWRRRSVCFPRANYCCCSCADRAWAKRLRHPSTQKLS